MGGQENKYRKRRIIFGSAFAVIVVGLILLNPAAWEKVYLSDIAKIFSSDTNADSSDDKYDAIASTGVPDANAPKAIEVLSRLEVKGRAPKEGYARDKFYDEWPKENGCNLRQRILKRDFGESAKLGADNCTVISGSYYEPYNGEFVEFTEKTAISKNVQIDHIVALSDAWQKGAQYKTSEERFAIATDPLNLIAADASANMQKSDGDAATWLPKNKSFRCQYISRQISVKYKYGLWVSEAEKDAMSRVLSKCPEERAVGVSL
ncbi:HNH endonuclease [Candidatus Saccharibacteria bacterium]|nr:HNH endonuclease [Candidatus Saccharibacteria bacterium]